MDQRAYSGFTNWWTFCVHQWLTNVDEQEERYVSTIVNGEEDVDDGARALQEYVEENNPLSENSGDMYSELLTGALEEVNWREIAETLWDEEQHKEDDEDEEDEDDEDHEGDEDESEDDND